MPSPRAVAYEDGVVLRNYENKTFHYPQPKNGSSRELPMVGARTAHETSDEAFATCGDSYNDRDGFSTWGNSCGGDSDDQ